MMQASFHLEKSLFRFSSFTRGAQNGRAANELKRMLLGSKVYLRASVIIISKVIAERDPTTHKESCASTKRILYGYADRLRATNLSRLMSWFCFVVRPLWPTWYSPFCIVTTWKKNGVGDGPQPMGLCVGLGGVQVNDVLGCRKKESLKRPPHTDTQQNEESIHRVFFAAAAEGFGFRRRFRPWKMEIPGRVCTLSLAVVRNRRRPKERKKKLSLFFFFFFFFRPGHHWKGIPIQGRDLLQSQRVQSLLPFDTSCPWKTMAVRSYSKVLLSDRRNISV